jgi:hypothetical protein
VDPIVRTNFRAPLFGSPRLTANDRDRFTFEMLKEYLRHLRPAPFEEDFYMPPGSSAWLIQKTVPFTTVGREYTLEEARAARVL